LTTHLEREKSIRNVNVMCTVELRRCTLEQKEVGRIEKLTLPFNQDVTC
jgi:hypothetical protein